MQSEHSRGAWGHTASGHHRNGTPARGSPGCPFLTVQSPLNLTAQNHMGWKPSSPKLITTSTTTRNPLLMASLSQAHTQMSPLHGHSCVHVPLGSHLCASVCLCRSVSGYLCVTNRTCPGMTPSFPFPLDINRFIKQWLNDKSIKKL